MPHKTDEAVTLHQMIEKTLRDGDYEKAEILVRERLRLRPNDSDLLHALAIARAEQGDTRAGEALFRQALAIDPEQGNYLANLGLLLAREGRETELFDMAEIIGNAQGNPIEAEAAIIERIARREPEKAASFIRETLRRHGGAALHPLFDTAQRLRINGSPVAALAILDLSVEFLSGYKPPTALMGEIALCLIDLGQHEQGAEHLERVLADEPDNAVALTAMGTVYRFRNQLSRALQCFRQALEADPNLLLAQLMFVGTVDQSTKPEEAVPWALRLLGQCEKEPVVLAQVIPPLLGTIHADVIEEIGGVEAALDKIPPLYRPSVFLGALTEADSEGRIDNILHHHKCWGDELTKLAQSFPLPPLRRRKGRAGKKLRIGLLSSDLRRHSVGRFAMSLINGHDPDEIELYCYSPHKPEQPDPQEEHVKGTVARYRYVDRTGDRDLAARIRTDKVDILLEMNGMTRYGRIGSIPWRAAPVQIEWLGYPFSTGLADMDYLLVDPWLQPEQACMLREKPLVMPRSWVALAGIADDVEMPIDAEPPRHDGYGVTFGTLNNSYKYTSKTLDLWARVLLLTPDSRLLVVRPNVGIILQSNLAAQMSRRGVDPKRVFLIDNMRPDASGSIFAYWEYYNLIDVSLDTMPLTGGTTTLDALLMGVPVVTWVGPGVHQRISYAILKHLGLDELCCWTKEEYLVTATRIAGDIDLLRAWRASLRTRIRHSPLGDPAGFCDDFSRVMHDLAIRHGLRAAPVRQARPG